MFNRKPKAPSFYQEEFAKLQKQLTQETPGTEEYRKVLTAMQQLQAIYGKQKFSEKSKSDIATKIVSFLGFGGLAFGLSRFEKNGNLFSGVTQDAIKGLLKIGTKFCG